MMTAGATISETHVLAQTDFDRFARISRDDNPIHVDTDFAARTRFGRTVSHGMLLASILWSMVRRHWPEAARQLSQNLMFPNPAYADEPLRFTATIGHITAEYFTVSIAVERVADGTMTCEGRAEFATGEGAVMKVGDKASVTRTFDRAALADFLDLTRNAPPVRHVPEPLISGMISYLLGVELPGSGTNYLKQETSFIAPAPLGEPITATVEITRLRPEKFLCDLSTTCTDAAGNVLCTGRALVLIKDVAKPIEGGG